MIWYASTYQTNIFNPLVCIKVMSDLMIVQCFVAISGLFTFKQSS